MLTTDAAKNGFGNNFRTVSRLLTIVENSLEGYEDILKNLPVKTEVPVIGITGPPGAGKSSLVAKLIEYFVAENKRIAVVAVDPTSPFSYGSLLGDRIRMQSYSTHPLVYIRSVASRGSLGGLSAKIIEITDVLRSSGFDYVFVETVGVGQSEVEIAALADLTLVVLVPEAGDEIQSIKSGIMEIGNAFVLNKADREGAEAFARHLKSQSGKRGTPVFLTVATQSKGISELVSFIRNINLRNGNKPLLLAQKAWKLMAEKQMQAFNQEKLQQEIAEALTNQDFNLYKFVEEKLRNS